MSDAHIAGALVARVAHRFEGDVVFMGAFSPEAHHAATDAELSARWWCDDVMSAAALDRAGARTTFGLLPPPASADEVVVALPKGRDAQAFAYARAAHAVRTGGRLWLVGAVNGGVKSAARRLEARGTVTRIDAARHGATFCAGSVTHEPVVLDAFVQWHGLAVPGEPLDVAAFPGVFASGGLDDGTRMLLDALGDIERGPVLDVGCGTGVVGAWLARRGVGAVTMVDSAAAAVASATRTVDRLGIDGVTVSAGDVYRGVGNGFALIVSNPPFHQGVATDYEVGERLIREAPAHLAPGGRLRIVANRFLRLPDALDAAFGSHTVLREDGRFRVYEARRRA